MYKRTRIKMCGTTRIEDARKAVDLGVDAIGFIFAKKSPRCITPEYAVEIVRQLPPIIFKVGVFVDEGPQEVEEIVHYLGLNGVQLHGNESVDYCQKMSSAVPSCSILKAFRVGEHSKASDFAVYNEVVDGFVLDTYVKGTAGGTGLTFDWNILKKLQLEKSYLLAGGLNSVNIQQALEVTTPFGVDVNSGVEQSPGVKDHLKLDQFIKNVLHYDDLQR